MAGKINGIEVNECKELPVKTEDEIKKYEIQENLSDVDKALLLLSKSNFSQKLSVLINLPKQLALLKSDQVLKKILKDLPQWSEELQIETASTIRSLISSKVYIDYKILDNQQLEDIFNVCKDLLQQWGSKALEEWIQVLSDLLQAIQFTTVKKECSNLVILLSEISQPLESKMCAAQIFGYLCNSMAPSEYDLLFANSIRQLCHDYNWQVRKAMCDSLSKIILAYKETDFSKELFLDEVIDLVADYEEEVRCSSINSFLLCFGVYATICQKAIFDVIKVIILKMTPKIAIGFTEKVGYLLLGIMKIPSDEIISIILTYLEGIQTVPLKLLLCYNLPAISQALGKDKLCSKVIALLEKLLIDGDMSVRVKAMGAIGEIVKIYGASFFYDRLRKMFVDFLRSADFDAVREAINVTPTIFEVIGKTRDERYDAFSEEISKELMKIQIRFRNHPSSVLFYTFITKFTQYIKRETILKYIIPVIIEGMQNCSLNSKLILAKHTAWLLKTVSYSSLRIQIHELLIKKFCHSPNFQDRITFIEFCFQITELMSKHYFKEYFLNSLCSLWASKTTEEAYRLCKYAPSFRKALLINDTEQASILMSYLKDYSLKSTKKYRYVAEAAGESLKIIMSQAFVVSDKAEKDLVNMEISIKKAEKKEIEEAKKQEIELLIKQARMDVMSKIAHPGPKSKTSSKTVRLPLKGTVSNAEGNKLSDRKYEKGKM